MTIAAVVTAAGLGTRLGYAVPKALVPVAGRPLLAHALDRVTRIADVTIVTATAGHERDFADAVEGRARIVTGGDSRQSSVWAGLQALLADGLAESDVVMVHDAARAFMPTGAMREAVAAVEAGADAAVPVVPIVDTLVTAPLADGTYGQGVDRDGLRAVQTPQVFRVGALVAAHRAAPTATATDDAMLVRALGHSVVATEGHPWGLKVTHEADLALAAFIAEQS